MWKNLGEVGPQLIELIKFLGGQEIFSCWYFNVNCTFVTYCIDEWSLRLTISIQSLVWQEIESCQMPKSWDFYVWWLNIVIYWWFTLWNCVISNYEIKGWCKHTLLCDALTRSTINRLVTVQEFCLSTYF